jgi:transcriptional regulator with XRE-family HTH domain
MFGLRDVLARNMRCLRAERGLSQEALAHECGINRTYLSGVEPTIVHHDDRAIYRRRPWERTGRSEAR